MCALVVLMAGLIPLSVAAQANAREELLMRALATSPSFRVRVQAAVALSHVPSAPRVLAVLRASLNDPHPSVQEACAAALQTLAGSGTVAVMAVPSQRGPAPVKGPAKYYVHIGEPSAGAVLPSGALKALRAHLMSLIGNVEGVRLAPEREDSKAASRVIERDGLVGFSVGSVVNTLEKRGDSVRANVAVVVATYPGRDIRAMLTGTASVSGRGVDEETQRKATAVAFESALRKLSNVLEASRLEARAMRTEAPRARARARR